jgi:hypothetical protein
MRALNVVLAVAVVAGLGFALLRQEPVNAQTSEPPPQPAQTQAPPPTGEPSNQLQGEVLEVLEVPSYVYLRIGEKGSGGTWTAVATAPIQVGQRVRVVSSTRMTSFRSATLDRTFDEIYFGTLDGQAAGGGEPQAELPAGNPHAGLGGGSDPHAGMADVKPAAPPSVGNVSKATGSDAYRVAEIHGKKRELAGKRIRIRGVVVKATGGILGKTYLHLRDGSGEEASGNHDLTVTSESTPKVGDTVTAEGIVAVDRDVGAGYRYDVILEDARLSAE